MGEEACLSIVHMFFRPDKPAVQVLLSSLPLQKVRQQKLLSKNIGLTCRFLEANVRLDVNNVVLKEINCIYVTNRAP